MKAAYTRNRAYPGNPFIEAFTRRFENGELLSRLEQNAPRPRMIDALPPSERQTLASRVFEVYRPLDASVMIYGLLYQSIISSYIGKNSVEAIRRRVRINEAQDKKRIPQTGLYATQAESFSVLGVPGIGKTSVITRILSMFPQVIEHWEYQGVTLFCKQIVYIAIQCPGDCSVKSACVYILSEIDKAAGTSYSVGVKSKSAVNSALSFF